MMQKLTSAVDATTIRVAIVTMDSHFAGPMDREMGALKRELPGLQLSLHSASDWTVNPTALDACLDAIAKSNIIIVGMLFLEDHFKPVLEALTRRRDACDALVCMASAPEVVKLTRMGGFDMSKPDSSLVALLKRLRGGSGAPKPGQAGAHQMKMLRRIPQFLKYIPGTAQDVRAYFVSMQYWMSGSDENFSNMIRFVVSRYADGPRKNLRKAVDCAAPVSYPEVGLYHPRIPGRFTEDPDVLPRTGDGQKRVGVLLMRSYLLAGDVGHYDGVIATLEARGLTVVPAFASGLDARPAIERFFVKDGRATIDALVSLTGFSLVGGPAYNDAKAAEEVLTRLDVPYVAAHPSEFQTLESWGQSSRGILPVESTMMVAIPELEGATGPMVFGGRSSGPGTSCNGCDRQCSFEGSKKTRAMHVCIERAEMLAHRVQKLVALRRSTTAERKIAIVLFNFPPNAGNIGTAAYLSVFQSLFNTLTALKSEGYTVDVPADVDALRSAILVGNKSRFGTDANVAYQIPADDHVRREPHLAAIERQWGPAPGRQLSDGNSIFVLGAQLGHVLVAVQPSMGYEGDPMRLLFEKGFAPTHAFSAFYRYLREDFKAHSVLHFGTHGALEFMPGKQTGLSADCWPDRLIGDMPNIYLYAANNPSEGAIARRRSAATLVSYMTPPVAHSGLYRGLVDLKSAIVQWHALPPDAGEELVRLAELIQSLAVSVDLKPASETTWGDEAAQNIAQLGSAILELEYTLIPHGLHVVGQLPSDAERIETLTALADASHGQRPSRDVVAALVSGQPVEAALATAGPQPDNKLKTCLAELAAIDQLLTHDYEVPALLRALGGHFIQPAPGGDLLRTPAILPTGRNVHGFDPFRIPSNFAIADGARQCDRLIARHVADGNPIPETVAIVLWGTDNLKTEGAPIGQALALIGAKPRFDVYGRLAGATLIDLAELDRPRIDVVITISGIFRDLLPLQIKLLAEACLLAASADEDVEQNFVRKHVLAYMAAQGCDLETAALRVFGNADGAYGANVGNLLESGRWNDEDELAETYTRRKSFAYGRTGQPVQNPTLLNNILSGVDLAYQNLDSVELGVTAIDTYFDTLGGISRAVRRAKGGTAAPVYIGDQTRGEGTVRTLGEQVSLETRTRMLNPKWTEGMLKHGYEGVRQIEVHITNTLGWSATTGEVAPWVYKQLTETFVLDPVMRERLATLNPTASAKLASRLIEAHERHYWEPDDEMREALQEAGQEFEDRLEGIGNYEPKTQANSATGRRMEAAAA